MDAVVRLLPGVMGNEGSPGEESFGAEGFEGLLEYPLYTRPAVWQGRPVPAVLTSGHHEQVRQWRRAQAAEFPKTRRPELWARYTQGQRQLPGLSTPRERRRDLRTGAGITSRK